MGQHRRNSHGQQHGRWIKGPRTTRRARAGAHARIGKRQHNGLGLQMRERHIACVPYSGRPNAIDHRVWN